MTTLIGGKNQARRKRAPPRARGKPPIVGAIKAAQAAAGAAYAEQEGRWGLWVPLFALFGAVAYLTAAREPAWAAAAAALVAFAGAGVAAAVRSGGMWRPVAAMCVCGAATALGFVAADLKTALVDAPRLERMTGPVALEGWIVEVDPGARREQATILVRSIEGVTRLPRFVKLSVDAPPSPGRAVRCLAILRPPDGPLAPGGYDAARRLYFERIGATGFALGACRPTAWAEPASWIDGVRLKAAALRRDVTDAVLEAAPGEGGAIAAAMITGERSFLSEDTQLAFRDSGLAHLLSVSGLHMALAAGGVFALLHALLALVPPLALRFPIRKWAAAGALAAGAAYLMISGLSVPAQRAFIMTAVALGAILVDRAAFTMRGLATALTLIVLLQPEATVDPGLQMSFAATAALVAAFEERPRDFLPSYAPGLLLGGLDRAWKALSAMLLASLVAGLATDPFALYHFQRVSVYGLPANLAATPIISFLVAPAAVAAAALAPFGLAEPALHVMAGALDAVRAIGAVFAERPEAVRALPRMPEAAFLAACAALAWACVWRGQLRWGAVGIAALAVALYVFSPKPVLWADGDLKAIVARAATDGSHSDSDWIALAGPRATFQKGRLAGLAGIDPEETQTAPQTACGEDVCVWRTPGGRTMHVILTEAGAGAACAPAAIVLAKIPPALNPACKPAFLSTPEDRASQGGLSLTETGTGFIVRRVRQPGALRPWSGPLSRSGE